MGLDGYPLEEIKYTEFMKPYFDDVVDFNISYYSEYIICAISKTHKAGIDIEEIRNIPFDDFDTQFSDTEWKSILAAEYSMHAFYMLWTQKESFIKAIGSGMNVPLNRVIISANKIAWNNEKWFCYEITLDTNTYHTF